ncbi:MAG: acetylxylan esterase [Opitutaceae bacterium]|nr:acetylxylan esterase [Opitutaceae bacterium]
MLLLFVFAASAGIAAEADDAGMLDRYLAPIAARQLSQRAAEVDSLQTPEQVKARQKYIHERLLAQIGGLPEKRTPLRAKVTGVVDGGDYTVEKVVFESLPRYYVTANVYVPKNARPPFPAVLGPAGHSSSGKAAEPYQRAWISLAKRGILVLAWDPMGQGERIQYPDAGSRKSRFNDGGPGEHTMAGIQCLLTGTNVARYFIWDGIRALDYLLTRGDVDPARIGVAGNSGGGTMTCYLAAFEPRIAVAAPSCYLTSWQELWPRRGPQDAEQVFVNFIADGLNFADFLTAFAPKPLQMATATRDYFPIAGAKATYAEARRLYTILGAANHVGFFEYDDTHGWSKPRREATYRWFSQWLLDRKDDGLEPEFAIVPSEVLHSTASGQVATSYSDAETLQSLNAARARAMYPQRTAARSSDLAGIVRRRLGISEARPPAAQEEKETSRHARYRIETFELIPEPGIVLPAHVFVPEGGPERKPAVIYLDPAGAMTGGGPGGPIEALVNDGNMVLAVDPRGYGRSAPRGRIVGVYSPEYSTAMRALLVGRNLPGMQTEDILSAFDFLTRRPDVALEQVRLIARDNGAVPALFAALLEPRFTHVTLEGGPESYLALCEAATHRGLLNILVPGVLLDFDLPDIRSALGKRLDPSIKPSAPKPSR